MKQLLCILILAPYFGLAQPNKTLEDNDTSEGIRFSKSLSWEQLLNKAKKENKYIFVDCYATWCSPCKLMESEVYPKKVVGEFMNKRFISVKVQMDSSKNDDQNIQNWYSDAHLIKSKYKISAFPTYLFFSPDGKLRHRYLGAMGDSLFLKMASNALNPRKQYNTLLDDYKQGKKEYPVIKYLASISKTIGEDSLANAMAMEYFGNYLNRLNENELLQKEHLDFINSFATELTSKDKIFWVMQKRGKEVDHLLKMENYSKTMIVDIITREEIKPKVWPAGKPVSTVPDWKKLTDTIEKKFGDYYAGLSIVYAQLKWYRGKKDTAQIIKYTVKKIDTYGIDTSGIGWAIINNVAYQLIFLHCNNKDTLNKAIGWMDVVLKGHPEDAISIDTYANLLYKAGKRNDAILWQQKAVKIESENAQKEKREPEKGFREILEKMESGIPTWLNE